MSEKFDVVVVGNGAVAYATVLALALKNKSTRIALVGPPEKPACASIAAGAMLNLFGEVEKDTLSSPVTRARFEIGVKSAKLWPSWVEQINKVAGSELIKINFGTHIVQNTAADDLDDQNYAAVLKALKDYNEDFEEVDPAGIKGYRPEPTQRAVRAVFVKNEGSIPSKKLAQAYEQAFAKLSNVTLVPEIATNIVVKDSGEKEVKTAGGKPFSTQQLVLAAGAKTQDFIDQVPSLKARIPRIFYGVGSSIILRTNGEQLPEKVLRTVNRGLACGVHSVPYDQNTLYVGASNMISPVPVYNHRLTSVHTIMKAAMEQINRRLFRAEVLKIVLGHRPTTADLFPLLGETSVKGLWILSGTKRDGLFISPYVAQNIAEEMNGGKSAIDPTFKPERKLVHTMTKEEGIAKAVAHMKSAAYQHDLELPKSGWDDMVDDMLRRRVEDVYAKAGVKTFGIHPELIDMYKYGHILPE